MAVHLQMLTGVLQGWLQLSLKTSPTLGGGQG